MFRQRIKRTAAVLLCVTVMTAALLTGCGSRVVMTRGLGEKELFRIGSGSCQVGEYMVYLLDLQKQCERMFGTTIWAEDTEGRLKEVLRNKALSEVSRVKALNLLAVRDNIMLTNAETDQCRRAASDYFGSLTDDERVFIGLTEEELQNMMMDYALAVKVYRSLGTSFTERYNAFTDGIDSDMNLPLWNTVTVRRVYGDPQTRNFRECYTAYFGEASLPETEEDLNAAAGELTEETEEQTEEQTEGAENAGQ